MLALLSERSWRAHTRRYLEILELHDLALRLEEETYWHKVEASPLLVAVLSRWAGLRAAPLLGAVLDFAERYRSRVAAH